MAIGPSREEWQIDRGRTHSGRVPSAGTAGERSLGTLGRSRADLVPLGMLLFAALVYVLRSPTSILASGLWAEDGTILFKDAIERGWSALFDPYAGQLIILQRLAATILAPAPAVVQPLLYAVASIGVAVLSCAIVLSSRWRDTLPLGVRFACLLALLCVPSAGEVHLSLVNSHWWLGIGLLLLGMLRDPVSHSIRIGEIGFAALVATSGFAALYAIPALAVRLVRNRSRHSLLVLAVALVGVGVQVGYLLGSGRRGSLTEIVAHPVIGLHVFAKRIMATAALGETNLAVLWPFGQPSVSAILVPLVLTAALALIAARGARMEVGALLVTLIGGWFLGLWALTNPDASLEMLLWQGAASRYFVVPIAVLYIGLIVSRPPGPGWMAVTVLASGILLVGIAADYLIDPRPRYEWAPFAECVDHARGQCSTTIAPAWSLQVEARGP